MNSELYISEDESNDAMDECKRDITANLDKGVVKSILQGGRGKSHPIVGDDVLIHMVAQLQKDGSVFINTRSPENPIRSQVGSNELPAGVNLALTTMKVDEIATITCTPEYGYGSNGASVGDRIEKQVPPNSTLVIEVHLIDFRFNDCTSRKDGGVIRLQLEQDGDGNQYPIYDSRVKCRLIGYTVANSDNDQWTKDDFGLNCNDWTQFDDREIEWVVGEAAVQDIPHGIDVAVRCMLQNEQSLFKIHREYAHLGSKCTTKTRLASVWPASAQFVIYRIKLLNNDSGKEYYQFESQQRLDEGVRCKELGNEFYKNDHLPKQMAIRRFKRAIELFEVAADKGELTDVYVQALFACYLNIVKAYLDVGTTELAHVNLLKASELQPNSNKLRYRFGCYYAARQMFKEAMDQFSAILAQQPDNVAARNMFHKCKNAFKNQKKTEREMYQRMLGY